MIKIIFPLLLANISVVCLAQTSETTYYNNQYLEKEKTAKTGKYSKTIIHNEDKTVTTLIKNVKTNELVNSISHLGEEPVGLWLYKRKNNIIELDYNFTLNYIKEANDTSNVVILTNQYFQKDSLLRIKTANYLYDNVSLNYVAPKMTDGQNIIQVINKNIIYPQKAVNEGIYGRVTVIFTVTKSGITDNFQIVARNNIILEKEAVRVLKSIKFLNPPTLNGQKKSIGILIPIMFKLPQ